MKFASLVLCGLLGLAGMQQQALSQSWPSKPIRIFSGYAAGGPSDLIVRPIATHLSGVFGHQVLV